MTAATITATPTGSRTVRAATNRAGPSRLARPSVRGTLIRRVRAEIAGGSYVTEVKLDTAAERLLDRIAGPSQSHLPLTVRVCDT